MTKRFESEVGASLTKLNVYRYKAPDSKWGVGTAVDYSTISIDGTGWRVELEAKETRTQDRLPFNEFSPVQLSVLRDVNRQGGLGVALVNFARHPLKREAGLVGAFRWPFLPEDLVPMERLLAYNRLKQREPDPRLRRNAPPSIFLEDAEYVLERMVGSVWPLAKILRREAWRA